ncbi:MAG: GspH/FimT family pseudopilin [Candidatus Eisenbacteria bacterium]|nr:GspH/FimT family pseudopilin [Candidatus Eisenbacteria bacterium]
MIELSIVIVIVIILVVTVAPRFLSTLSSGSVDTASKQVASALRFARQMAITTRHTTQVIADANPTKVLVVSQASGDTLYIFGLSGGASVLASTNNPTFQARGTAVGATITVGDAARSKQVIVNAVGRVRIQNP